MEGVTSPPLEQGSPRNNYFNPLLISMVGIVVTSIAIIAYHFLLVRYCIRRHTAAQPPTAVKPPVGVDEKVLKAIPIVAFSAVKRCTDQLDHECVVCLGELEDEDMVRLIPKCKHAFHAACIDQWFARHESCPVCRSTIHEQTDAAKPVDPHTTDDDSGIVEEPRPEERSSACVPPVDRPTGVLRHCDMPPATELKRSLSADRSFVLINLRNNNNYYLSDSSSTSPSRGGRLARSGSCSAASRIHFDRSAVIKWLRSPSLMMLQMGKDRNAATPILPY